MTRKEFIKQFRYEVLDGIRESYEQDGRIDYPARREAWNNVIDDLVEFGELPERAVNWVCPW